MPAAAVIELRDVAIAKGDARLVRSLTCDVTAGRVLALVADEAESRSALAAVLSGDMSGFDVGGDLVIEGRELLSRAGEQARVFAERYVSRVSPAAAGRDRVREFVAAEVKRAHHVESARGVDALLDLVGFDAGAAESRLGDLAATERVRVGFAFALASNPLVLVVELPRAIDDANVYAATADCVRRIGAAGDLTVVVITDGLAIAADVADDAVLLLDGLPVEIGSIYDVSYRPAMPYTQALVAATPSAHVPLPDLGGHNGVLAHTGCPWRLNCDRVLGGVCAHAVPRMTMLAPGHAAACHLLNGSRDV